MAEFRVGQDVDGITAEGDVKLRVVGMHDGSPIVQVRETFLRGDVEHQQGEVFVADPINLIRSDPNEGWLDWEPKGIGDGYYTETRDGQQSLTVTFYKGAGDAKPVIQIDGAGDFRINVNDGVLFDRHTDSADPLHDAALTLYQAEVGRVEYSRHYSVGDMHKLRDALISAGYRAAEVDRHGKLDALHCTTCDTVDALEDGLCQGCREQEHGAPASE